MNIDNTLSIEKIWVPSPLEWDEAWLSCPYSTYFQSREWAEIWKEYSHGGISPDPISMLYSDGTKIILPFSKTLFLNIFTKRHISSPAGTYGGWLSTKSLDKAHQYVLSNLIKQKYSDLEWRFNPYDKVIFSYPEETIIEDETMTINLSPGFDKVFHNWSRGCISSTKKAQKAGLQIHLAESPDAWRAYYDVYQDSICRWGENATSYYPWDLFQILLNHSSSNQKLWLASYNQEIIAGAICFYSPTQAVYWHGAAYSKYFELRPINLIMYEAIRDAIERGLSWFDFNPSGGHIGVRTFKSRFGAIPLESKVWIRRSKRVRFLSTIASFLRSNIGTR